MTSDLPMRSDIVLISRELARLIHRIEESLSALNHASGEALVAYRENFRQFVKEGNDTLARVKVLMASLPREIKRREMTAELKMAAERCEAQWRSGMAALEARMAPGREQLQAAMTRFREGAVLLSTQIRSFELHPLVHKILEGGRVLASRKDLQWRRKMFHTANGLFGLWLWGFSGLSAFTVEIVVSVFLTGAVLTEVIRRVSPAYNERVCKYLKVIMRERERTRISSATWYLVAVLIVFLVFPPAIGMFTLFYVAVGDTAAGIVGTLFGEHQIKEHVSLEGFLAMFGVSALGTALLIPHALPHASFGFLSGLLFCALAGLAAALSESLIKKFDDNLTIPLLSAPALLGLLHLFRVI